MPQLLYNLELTHQELKILLCFWKGLEELIDFSPVEDSIKEKVTNLMEGK